MAVIDYAKAERFVANTDPAIIDAYGKYWSNHRIQRHIDLWHAIQFAITAIRTQARYGVEAFKTVAALPLTATEAQIYQALRSGGFGMYHKNAKSLAAMAQLFCANPNWWYPQPGETMMQARNRIAGLGLGLGPAKAAFIYELNYPFDCPAVCVDSCLLQEYGVGKGNELVGKQIYDVEQHWMDICAKAPHLAPLRKKYRYLHTLLRHHQWSFRHNLSDTRSWSVPLLWQNRAHYPNLPALLTAPRFTVPKHVLVPV